LPSAERRLSLKDLRSSVIIGLIKTGLLDHESQIEVEQIHTVRYGYALFTPGCQQMVKAIIAFLAEQSINVVGRYATWEYMSLEDCVLAGQEVAGQVNAY
jgi:protoporphyrinogen oxidase